MTDRQPCDFNRLSPGRKLNPAEQQVMCATNDDIDRCLDYQGLDSLEFADEDLTEGDLRAMIVGSRGPVIWPIE